MSTQNATKRGTQDLGALAVENDAAPVTGPDKVGLAEQVGGKAIMLLQAGSMVHT